MIRLLSENKSGLEKSDRTIISVLLPVYNAETHLKACLRSLLNQSFGNFELIIFNDASTDKSLEIIQKFTDSRIKLIDSPTNKGYVFHLNHGLEIAEGKYIARMDADDICMPDRFEKQLKFLEENPSYDVCGSWVKPIDHPYKKEIWQLPSDHSSILIHHFFYNTAMAHPSVMFRKEVIDKHQIRYDPNYMPAEDYELWTRISQFAKFKNITEPLLQYRQHPGQISQVQSGKKEKALAIIRRTQLRLLKIDATDDELGLSMAVSNRDFPTLAADVDKSGEWLLYLYEANRKSAFFKEQLFNKELGYLWWMTCTTAAKTMGRKILRSYRSNKLKNFYRASLNARVKLHLKAFLSH